MIKYSNIKYYINHHKHNGPAESPFVNRYIGNKAHQEIVIVLLLQAGRSIDDCVIGNIGIIKASSECELIIYFPKQLFVA